MTPKIADFSDQAMLKTERHDPEKVADFSDQVMLKARKGRDPEKLQTFRTRSYSRSGKTTTPKSCRLLKIKGN
jgi:hypothetical protein